MILHEILLSLKELQGNPLSGKELCSAAWVAWLDEPDMADHLTPVPMESLSIALSSALRHARQGGHLRFWVLFVHSREDGLLLSGAVHDELVFEKQQGIDPEVHLLSDSFAGSFGSAVQLARRGPNCKLQPLIVRIVGLSETVGSENVGLSILVLHGTGIFTYIWA